MSSLAFVLIFIFVQTLFACFDISLLTGANCSYCHNGNGEARTTGLVLLDTNTDTTSLGACKSPIAAGKAAAGQQYDIVPGQPGQSILIYRVTSILPSIAMPEIGRSLEHVEGVQLLSDWVTGMTGSCPSASGP